jgi:hypothetical protein
MAKLSLEVIGLRRRSRLRSVRQAWNHLAYWVGRRANVIVQKAGLYLKPRYWVLYLVMFGLGFYLFGPTRGWQKLRWVNKSRRMREESPPAIATLQRELRTLKRDLKQLTATPSLEVFFTPERFGRPAAGKVIQGYQWFLNRHIWRLHPGVDLAVPLGSSVLAAASGRVVNCDRTSNGFTIKLYHGNDWESIYDNLTGVRVQTGQTVLKGQAIGISGLVRCVQPEQAGFHFGLYHLQQPVDPCQIISGL